MTKSSFPQTNNIIRTLFIVKIDNDDLFKFWNRMLEIVSKCFKYVLYESNIKIFQTEGYLIYIRKICSLWSKGNYDRFFKFCKTGNKRFWVSEKNTPWSNCQLIQILFDSSDPVYDWLFLGREKQTISSDINLYLNWMKIVMDHLFSVFDIFKSSFMSSYPLLGAGEKKMDWKTH